MGLCQDRLASPSTTTPQFLLTHDSVFGENKEGRGWWPCWNDLRGEKGGIGRKRWEGVAEWDVLRAASMRWLMYVLPSEVPQIHDPTP